ncbi:Gfo/Idh/MocA family protein [Paenibacillus sp. strain BS8-2]
MTSEPSVPNVESKTIKVVIVGAGSRAMNYASYAQLEPDKMQVVGVVDPDPVRRRYTADTYGFDEGRCFSTVEELLAEPKFADAVINGTLDPLHVPTTLPLLQAGYDVLLEKPIGIHEEEVMALYDMARAHGRKVMICHVLRYAPFYAEIQKRIQGGDIGDIVHIRTEENVSYHHMATAFVRGKWGNVQTGGSTMLMAKCCHDLDLITWFKNGIRPSKVSSYGGIAQFRVDKAPAGSGTRCLNDCAIEDTCNFSAKKLYLDQPLWGAYVWPQAKYGHELTDAEKLEWMRTDNPYGRCVWRCDNDVVDHQTVMIEFEDGSTAMHSLSGNTAKPCRTIHIVGTKGEIEGVMETGEFIVRHPDVRPGGEYKEEIVRLQVSKDMHGGGDRRIIEDFIGVVSGDTGSRFTTSLANSIFGHLVGFRADRARLSGQVEEVPVLL